MSNKKSTTFKIINCENEIEKLYHVENKNKPKRLRLKLNHIQIEILEKLYHKNSYPTKNDHEAISDKLNIPLKNVKIWFQNRRAKQKSDFEENEKERTEFYTKNNYYKKDEYYNFDKDVSDMENLFY